MAKKAGEGSRGRRWLRNPGEESMTDTTGVEESAKIRVLLVDDSPIFLDVTKAFLQRRSDLVVVGTVRRGEEVLSKAESLRPRIILVDLNMPGLGGLETIRRLRTMWPGVGIIAVTILDGDVYRQAALGAGADAFVSKFTLYTDLLPAIRRLSSVVS
jgi:DNA-binding NarL/FixJ family response regulator